MAIYITLMNFTGQGIHDVKDSTEAGRGLPGGSKEARRDGE